MESTYSIQVEAVVDGLVYATENWLTLHAIGACIPRLDSGGTVRVGEKTSLRGGSARTAVARAERKSDTAVTIVGESVTTGDVIW